MTSNINSFILQVQQFTDVTAPELVVEATKKLGIEAFSRVIRKTPVDTGRARANWFATIGTPSERVSPNQFDKSGSRAVSRVVAKAESVKPFGSFFLANNLTYIQKLESGSSTQAPNGMVGTTFAELRGTRFD